MGALGCLATRPDEQRARQRVRTRPEYSALTRFAWLRSVRQCCTMSARAVPLFAALMLQCAGSDPARPGSDGGAGANAQGGVNAQGGRAGVGGSAGLGGNSGTAGAEAQGGGASQPRVLIFSRTVGFRHVSIADGQAALLRIARERGWEATATEDAATFSHAALAGFNVVVFLNTSGDVLNSVQEAAFERFIRAGKGFVGIHAASDTEYDWEWYGALVGAYFKSHPAVQRATLRVEGAAHPLNERVPSPWVRTDEWYSFLQNPRGSVRVLLTIDEASYAVDGHAMGADHPLAWFHEYDGGRAFYTALGHTQESYAEAAFLAHLTAGIEWAAVPSP